MPKKKATIDLAQNVIYKQMMVAQNIAGLLGETTGGDEDNPDEALFPD